MKILVSAYACEPYKGSEPGIGWNFVNEMSRYHEVHVITRTNNQEGISKSLKGRDCNLIFHYYDLPKFFLNLKKGRRFYQPYYYLWQIGMFFKFKKFVNTNDFDIVHHVTFGADWMPSLLMMTKPFSIFGPVGSEEIYNPILKSLPYKLKVKELIRRWIKMYFYYLDPSRWLTLIYADLIISHSSKYVPYKYPKFLSHKVRTHHQTGLNITEPEYAVINKPILSDKKDLIFIIASEFFAWKGVLIAAEVFSRLAHVREDIKLVVLGDGPERENIKAIFDKYNVNHLVVFKGFVSKKELLNELYKGDILLYPAYHHGFPTVILQSMYAYTPIIGMEGDIISQVIHGRSGLAAKGNSLEEIINDLLNIAIYFIDNPEVRLQYALNGRKMVEEELSWHHLAKSINNIYLEVTS